MNNEKSVLKCGAEYGLFFGLYLSATFLSFIYSTMSPFISMVGLALFLGTPIVLGTIMYQYHISHPESSSFSSVWTCGSTTFVFGALIWAAVAYTWLEYIEPGFIITQAKEALALYESNAELKNLDFTKALRLAIENKDLPTPIEFSLQMLWTSISFGMFTALIITPFVRLFKPKAKSNNNK